MRVEEGWLILDGAREVKHILREAQAFDEYRMLNGMYDGWNACGSGIYTTYSAIEIRRHLSRCTPEVLERAGLNQPTEAIHFL